MKLLKPAAILLACAGVAGFMARAQKRAQDNNNRAIDRASEDSFPASDPPSWNAR